VNTAKEDYSNKNTYGGKMGLFRMYIENMMGYMIVAMPFYVIGRVIFLKKKKKQVKLWHEVVLAVFVLYIVGIASQTIIPRWDMGVISATGFYFNVHLSNDITKVNLIPFRTLYQYFFQTNENVSNWGAVSLLNISGNMFLFSPIGFFVPLIWQHLRSFRKILLVGLSVTCFIEIVQLFIGRSTDIDDIILNTIGVIIGYGIFLLKKVKRDSTAKNIIHNNIM